jgi:type II secretory ATPase GspE/PulE/Tfp pilus assembly ATPase PilB-like protein
MSIIFPILLLVIILACVGSLYHEGMWGNALNMINVILAGLLAFSFAGPLMRWMLTWGDWFASIVFFLAFISLWLIFCVSLIILRMASNLTSRVKVKFIMIANRVGSGIFALLVGWFMVCFTTATLHTAPLSKNFMWGGFDNNKRMLFGLAPDRQWLGLVNIVSKGAFSRGVEFDDGGFRNAFEVMRSFVEKAAESGSVRVSVSPDTAEMVDRLPKAAYYLSIWKLVLFWILFLLWVYSTDWVSRDTQEVDIPHKKWNPLVFGPFLGGFFLMLVLPWFLVSYPVLILTWVVPLAVYVVQRNKMVDPHERVMTKDHLRHWFARKAKLVGIKIKTEEKDPHEVGPAVVVAARGGPTPRDETARLLSARQAPGLTDARQMMSDALTRRADSIMLDYTQEAVAVRWLVDGVWHNAEAKEREVGDPALESLKILCGLNPQDRQSRQSGKFGLTFQEKTQYGAMLTSQGTQTGERVLIQFEGKKTTFESLEKLGMRPQMQEKLKELLAQKSGFMLFSAMPANGLRTTTTLAISGMDRFLREFIAVEDEAIRYQPIENVPAHTYSKAQGQTPDMILPELFLKEPNVVVVRDLVNARTVSLMCQEIMNERLMIGTVRAKDCAEALLRVLALKVPPSEFADAVIGVLNQRLIRKLCEHCKEAYQPPPQLLQQLRIPPGRVQLFYRPPQNPEEPCPECQGIGYIGRTAIFELLAVDPTVRQALATTPKLDVLRATARKAGFRGLQEEGIVMVAKGLTSLQELMRVMKQ